MTKNIFLLGGGNWHARIGSPKYPTRHEQVGAWLITRHSAFKPQTPGHGSTHFWLTQALFFGQSLFITHSGRHSIYGSPKYSGRQEHEPAPTSSRQTAFTPQGDGEQGCAGSSYTILYVFFMICNVWKKDIIGKKETEKK